MHLLSYVLHYLVARLLYDELLRHGLSPLLAIVVIALVLALWRRRTWR